MSEVHATSRLDQPSLRMAWDRFWFSPGSVQAAARIRAALCLVTAVYFVGGWFDATGWLTGDAPFSSSRTGTFLQVAGLEDDARFTVSPLFLIDRLLGESHAFVYRGYLLVAVGLCIAVALGKGGKLAPWALWLLFAWWANRLVLLAGVTETLLSAGLFAAAIAPPASLSDSGRDWKAGFSLRLMATQITLFAVCTVAAMLSAMVWWNGYGALALQVPVEDRTLTLDWIFESAVLCDSVTHGLIIALPLGILLAWLRPRSWVGPAIVIAWSAVIAVLGSHWLYGMTLSVMVTAIGKTND